MAAVVHAVQKKKREEQRRKIDGVLINERVVDIFEKYDTDCSGDIDKKELRLALADLGVGRVTSREISSIMKKFGQTVTSALDLDMFDMLVSELQHHHEKVQEKAARQVVEKVLEAAPGGSGDDFVNTSCRRDGKLLPYQKLVWRLYNSQIMVWTVAALIIGNFFINILEKQIDADVNRLKYKDTWDSLDTAFNIIFLIELLMNMYSLGGPIRAFWRIPWNVFDFFIVSVGVILIIEIVPPESPVSKLKLLRAFRVFRLFKRIKSLNQIIVALIRAIPGVFNAFLVMLIFFCIYAVLAVELFRDFGGEGQYNTTGNPDDDWMTNTVTAETARGFYNGYEYYGTFMRALFTLFQVMTGESWSEAIARPLLFGLDSNNGVIVTLYYVSFILIMQFVLINVVVAVLLDKFVQDEQHAEPSEELHEDAVANLLGGGAPAAAAPAAERDLKHVQVTVAAPPAATTPSPSLLDAKLDAILAELKDLKNDLAATRSEIFNIKEARGSLAV
uniref:EF-hand domain-containing protein n=1 Tax=Haptolina brevifila TaxID=156173 RepID=A0A7S2BA23_9EUKA